MGLKRAHAGFVIMWLAGGTLSAGTTWAGQADVRLLDAVTHADAKAVRAMLRQHVDVSASGPDGTTPLLVAVQNDDMDITGALLQAGAKVNTANRYGVAPLHAACVNGSAAMVGTLLTAGAAVDRMLPAGETPLMTCARTGNVDALRALVAHGANVNATEQWHGQTALMWAAGEGHADAVAFLVGHGADMSVRSTAVSPAPVRAPGAPERPASASKIAGGFTALLFAAREGRVAAARALLDAGAPAGDTAPNGTSALMLAIINAHFELASMLLDRGADPNASDPPHGSPLHALQWVRRHAPGIGMGSSSIYPRMQSGNVDGLELAKKLLDKGANPNARFTIEDPKFSQGANGFTFYYVANPPDFALSVSTLNWDGATPFWLAAKNADAPFMRLMAAHGADPLMPNRVHVTPLMAAAGAGFMQGEHPGTEAEALEAAKVAIELGNDVNAIADFGPSEERADLRFSGLTALHGAAQRGANSIVQLLAAQGATLDAVTKAGWTPFNVADGVQIGGTVKNSPETAALLRKLMTDRGLAVKEIHLDNFTAAGGK